MGANVGGDLRREAGFRPAAALLRARGGVDRLHPGSDSYGHATRTSMESGHHAAHVSREVVRSMYDAAGASALYIECPLERAHRDIHAVLQHIVFAPFWMEAAGQVRLGLTPGNPIF